MSDDLNYALSESDIRKLFQKTFNTDIRIVTYDGLANYTDLFQLLPDRQDQCILHIPVNDPSKRSGHWVCILRKEKDFNFFDSYGKKVDRQLYFTNKKLRRDMFDEPYLTALFNSSKRKGANIVFNCHPYQDIHNDNSAVCGRWVSLRVAFFLLNKTTDGKPFLDYINRTHKKYFPKHTLDQMVLRLVSVRGFNLHEAVE